MGDSVLCSQAGEKLSGGRYNVVCSGRGEIERCAIQLCAERGEKLSGGRYNVVC